MTILTIHVAGTPVQQGNLRTNPSGVAYYPNGAKLRPWRDAIAVRLQAAMLLDGDVDWPILGPVKVELCFHLARPKSCPPDRTWPTVRPDIDKLERAALDAIQQSGAVKDDAQVVLLATRKEYGQPGMTLQMRALEQPLRRTA